MKQRPGPELKANWYCTGCGFLVGQTKNRTAYCPELKLRLDDKLVTPEVCPYRYDSTASTEQIAQAREFLKNWERTQWGPRHHG